MPCQGLDIKPSKIFLSMMHAAEAIYGVMYLQLNSMAISENIIQIAYS